ncbi:hypothetical protein [Veillonella tobetsuensis]|uniref:Uncharacterized protein n=1 Tax=Veillonella tobetsuensis TaxID=1110546 RepID=A0A2S7ZQF8_9FIRM|nr:hypothetical protein [Veillonella tobetsuensis]PQL25508.1 hypothetical protein VTHSUH11_05360 [Veillonella tobetsuensis]
MSTTKFTYKTYQAPTLFDGLQNASKEELSYLIALLRQQTMKNIFSDKFNSTVTTGRKAINSVMGFFGKSKKTNDDIDRESKENHQDINNKIKEEIRALQSYSQEQLYTLFIDEVREELDIPDSSLALLSNKIIASAAKTDPSINEELDIEQKADIIYQKTLQSIISSLEKQSAEERDEMIRQLDMELDNLSSDRKELIKQSLQTNHLSGEVLRNSFLKSGVGIGSLITVGSSFGAYIAINTIIHAIFTSFLGITLPFAVYTGVAKGVSIIAGPIGWCALGGYSIYSFIKTSGKLTSAMMSVVVFIAMTIYGKSFSVDENGAPLWITSDSIEYQEYQNNQYRIIQLNDKVKILSKDLALSQEKKQRLEASKQKLEKALKTQQSDVNNIDQDAINDLKEQIKIISQELSIAQEDRKSIEKKYNSQMKESEVLIARNKELKAQNITLQEESNYYQECSYEFEEKNKSLQHEMTEKENYYAQEIQELKEAIVEDEQAYDNDKKRLDEGKILQRKFEDFELEKQFLADYTRSTKTVRDDIDRMLIRLYKISDPTQIDATHNSKINSLGFPVYHMETADGYRLYYAYSKTSAKPIHILCHCIKSKEAAYFNKMKNSETLKKKFRN